MVGIYCVTNLINNKKYIGQSIKIESRWKEHRKNPFNPKNRNYNCYFYQAIRKYGIENFKFEVLEECKIEELDEREKYWISFYQTFPPSLGKGYNLYPGGDGNYPKLTNEQVIEIINLLKQHELSYIKISTLYGVNKSLIGEINLGHAYAQIGIEYPIRKDFKGIKKLKFRDFTLNPHPSKKLIPSYKELFTSFYELRNAEKVAQKYNISTMLLKKWCREYGINAQRKKEYIEKYEVEFLGKEPKKINHFKKVKQLNPKTNEIIKIWNNKTEIAKYYGVSSTCIDNVVKKHNLYKGSYWELIE